MVDWKIAKAAEGAFAMKIDATKRRAEKANFSQGS